MRKIDYLDPLLVLEYDERKEIGCFSCRNSKRSDFKSFCQILELGIGENLNYPDESKYSCKFYIGKKR